MTTQLPQHEPLTESAAQVTVNLTEVVAKTVAGTAVIGHAGRLLELAGYTATIVANRIHVNDEVEAHLMHTNGHSWWQVYRCDGLPPVWAVGAQVEQGSWIGAVE